MQHDLDYIEPEMLRFSNLKALLGFNEDDFLWRKNADAEPIAFKDLKEPVSRFFVIAEPGYGKSELLKQINALSNTETKVVLLRELNDQDQIYENTENDQQVFCFDGLDEVRPDNFEGILSKLKDFSIKHPESSIFISCRRQDAANHLIQFSELGGFKYLLIKPFSFDRITEYLSKIGIEDDESLQALMVKAKGNKDKTFLRVPRNLKAIGDLVKKNKVTQEQLKTWARIDFFERFIYEQLESEVEKSNGKIDKNSLEIAKRVLEKMALVMEIYQVNRITKDEFITFLDEAKSNINLVFLNTVKIDFFLERVMQSNKEAAVEYLEFQNTEFQEYLAAKELNRLASSSQVIYDFVIQPEFNQIYQNWYDVLRYLLEINPDHLLPLVEFLLGNKKSWIENAFWQLIETVDPKKLKPENLSFLFRKIYSYFQNSPGAFISDRIILSNFYTRQVQDLITSIPEIVQNEDGERQLQNQLDILVHVKDQLPAESIGEWTEKLKQLTFNPRSPRVAALAVRSLGHLGKVEDLIEIKTYIEKGDEDLRGVYLSALHNFNPNCQFALDAFFEGLLYTENSAAVEGINHVSEPEWIKEIMKRFIASDKDDFYRYLKKADEIISFSNIGFLKEASKHWDDDFQSLGKELLSLIFKEEFSFPQADKFKRKLIKILGQNNPNLLPDLLSIPEDPFSILYFYSDIIRDLLTKENTLPFINRTLELDSKYTLELGRIFSRLFQPGVAEQSEVYEIAKSRLPDLFERWENLDPDLLNEEERKQEEEQRIYQEFQKLLEPAPGKLNFNVFNFFVRNQVTISRYANQDELDRIGNWLRRTIPQVNPGTSEFGISRKDEHSLSISASNYVFFFPSFLTAAEALGILNQIQIPRQHLLGFLPLSFGHNNEGGYQKIILQLLGNVTAEDQTYLLSVLNSRDDDYLRVAPTEFAKTVEDLRASELVSVLENLVHDEKLSTWERSQILEILGRAFPNKIYLQQIFDQYKGPSYGLGSLAEISNRYLVSLFKDPEAIEYRFEAIKSMKRLFEEPKHSPSGAIRGVTDWESELYEKKWPEPLLATKDKSLARKFQELLGESLEMVHLDPRYQKYCNYILQSVADYYDAMREDGGYSFLKELSVFLYQKKFEPVRAVFSKHLTQLQIKYIDTHGRPKSIYLSVNKYNQIKSQNYLPLYNSRDLFHLVQQVIEEDIRNFVHQEGFYKVVNTYFIQQDEPKHNRSLIREDYIQKTLKIQLENALLRRGLRGTDIIREPQFYDDKRIDLLVKYGFIPPVVVELKLLHNTEIIDPDTRATYKNKIKQYMDGAHTSYGIYLVFKVKNVAEHDEHFSKLQIEYSDLNGLVIPGYIDCTMIPQ